MSNERDNEKEYWATIATIASEALEAEQRGEGASDYIHESVDGCHYVIYTYANLQALQWSPNESAAFDDMGGDALSGCNSYGEVMARLAYHAVKADIDFELGRLREDAEESEGHGEESIAPPIGGA